MIPFSPWLPDIADFNTDAAKVATNVVPSSSGYRPTREFMTSTSAINARAKGAIAFKALDGTVHNFCGNATKLYKMNAGGTAWADVSRSSGGAYATISEDFWGFATFGSRVMATNYADVVQSFVVGSSTLFTALTGSPPQAGYIGVVRDFVVLARLSSSQNALRWCGINDPTSWSPSATTMADAQEFPEGGGIRGFVGGEYGIVFQERAISRMSFEGPPLVFRFDKLSTNLGCDIPTSIAAYSNLAFFHSDDGFKMIRGGAEILDIGEDKVDRWFEERCNPSYYHLVSATIDPVQKLYVVAFPQGTTDYSDSILCYHWPTGQWSLMNQGVEMLYPALNQTSYTIDTMANVSSTIDGLTQPVDSRFWGGSGKPVLGGFDETHKFGQFNGPTLRATIETGDNQLTPGRKSMLKGFRPLVEGTDVAAQGYVSYRNRLGEPHLNTSPKDVNATGYYTTRVNARYHRIGVAIPADAEWTHATGFDDLKFAPMGAR